MPLNGGSGIALVKVDVPNITTNSNILTSSTSVDIATHITFTQTTANITATLLNPTVTTTNKTITLQNLVASTQSLTITAVNGDSFIIGIAQSIEVAWNGTSWRLLNPAQVLPEFGTVILANQIFNTTSFVNSTNGIYAIPSAGTWRLRYDVNSDGTGANSLSAIQIATSLGILVPGTERTRGSGIATAQVLTGEAIVTTTGTATYNLQGRNGGSGSFTILNVTVNTSTISWEKIGGYSNIIGQSVDYGSLIANGNASYGTVMHTVTTATNISPAAPFASNQTILFNGGTASVVQNGNLPVALATGIQTINKTGVYNIKISASLQANGASDSTVLQLVKNNTTPISASNGFNASGGNIATAHNLTYSGTLNAGDTLDVRVGANGVAAHAVYTISWTTTQVGTSAITLNTRPIVVCRGMSAVQSFPNGGVSTQITNWLETTDTTNSFNNTTGIFTAPITGQYMVNVTHDLVINTTQAVGTYDELQLGVNATPQYQDSRFYAVTSSQTSFFESVTQLNTIVNLNAGDTMYFSRRHTYATAFNGNTNVNVNTLGISYIDPTF
jgi:molybdate-binding protein